MKLTRRKLATAVLIPAAAAMAQTQPPPPGTPDEELKAARDRAKLIGEALAQQTLPMSTEPAFQFKA
jgi:dihydroxyacetone kinase